MRSEITFAIILSIVGFCVFLLVVLALCGEKLFRITPIHQQPLLLPMTAQQPEARPELESDDWSDTDDDEPPPYDGRGRLDLPPPVVTHDRHTQSSTAPPPIYTARQCRFQWCTAFHNLIEWTTQCLTAENRTSFGILEAYPSYVLPGIPSRHETRRTKFEGLDWWPHFGRFNFDAPMLSIEWWPLCDACGESYFLQSLEEAFPGEF